MLAAATTGRGRHFDLGIVGLGTVPKIRIASMVRRICTIVSLSSNEQLTLRFHVFIARTMRVPFSGEARRICFSRQKYEKVTSVRRTAVSYISICGRTLIVSPRAPRKYICMLRVHMVVLLFDGRAGPLICIRVYTLKEGIFNKDL